MNTARERVDCQSHVISPEFLAFLEKRPDPPHIATQNGARILIVNGWRRPVLPKITDIAMKLADMDCAGISMAALSMSDPGPELFGSDAVAIARMNNDYLSSLAQAHPARFFGLAALPYGSPDEILKEMDRALAKPGIKGILLFSNLNGRFPDQEPMRSLFAEAERRGTPVVLHPARPVTLELLPDFDMVASLGMMFDTTIALCRLILSGVLEEHPNLKLVCPHVGGVLPYLIGRLDYQVLALKRGGGRITRPPREYLKRVWFDTVTGIGLGIQFTKDFAGVDKLMFASDHPWIDPQYNIDALDSVAMTEAERQRVYSGTARELFDL
ncbi:MAG TPA: amidohydrolase family protein [Bryobacteraceae bacterium]|nr:amidohydrolase family protein [Bryobacteraceae bacterium]